MSVEHYTFLKHEDGGANTPISGERAAPFLRDPRLLTSDQLLTAGAVNCDQWSNSKLVNLQGCVVRERKRDPSRTTTPKGGLPW